ncbi:MAG: folate-binding protein YgfZ [Rhodospirillales bacterium]|nr:folate-binding protein YgfZ [Rhodospirillales bacterium]
MDTVCLFPLAGRGVLRVAGDDARQFLQGLISNDVARVSPARAMWAAFLTAQGRYLHDFFVVEMDGALLLEGEAARLADLRRRLSMYRLRSRVTIEPVDPPLSVWALTGDGAAAAVGLAAGDAGSAVAMAGGVIFVDPRLPAAGLRALLPAASGEAALVGCGFQPGAAGSFEARRIALGLPDGSRDLLIDKTLLLEGGFLELDGIDWDKGCYLGQELTARTRWRGLVKRRLLPMRVQGPLPPAGTPILLDGREIGEVRSGADGWTMVMLRLDALAKIQAAGGVAVEGAHLVPQVPSWAALPQDLADAGS